MNSFNIIAAAMSQRIKSHFGGELARRIIALAKIEHDEMTLESALVWVDCATSNGQTRGFAHSDYCNAIEIHVRDQNGEGAGPGLSDVVLRLDENNRMRSGFTHSDLRFLQQLHDRFLTPNRSQVRRKSA